MIATVLRSGAGAGFWDAAAASWAEVVAAPVTVESCPGLGGAAAAVGSEPAAVPRSCVEAPPDASARNGSREDVRLDARGKFGARATAGADDTSGCFSAISIRGRWAGWATAKAIGVRTIAGRLIRLVHPVASRRMEKVAGDPSAGGNTGLAGTRPANTGCPTRTRARPCSKPHEDDVSMWTRTVSQMKLPTHSLVCRSQLYEAFKAPERKSPDK